MRVAKSRCDGQSAKLQDIIPEIYRVMVEKRFGKRSMGISGKDVGG